ncbi:hypothetical protein ABEV00_25815 [Paenibacillus thiaminolyticus]|uniref:hypothetical protein n=1 Tax=Paenibacillus thiaminolyticus TaxID=49283 RepID=UPI003D296163
MGFFRFLRDGDIDHKKQLGFFRFLRDGDIDRKKADKEFTFLYRPAASYYRKKYRPDWCRTVRYGAYTTIHQLG